MISTLICAPLPLTAPDLATDLAAAGGRVCAQIDACSNLVQAVVRCAPELVICDWLHPTVACFEVLQVLDRTAPVPVIVLTHDADASCIALSVTCGVHVYAVQGYSASRLPALIALAQARFAQAQQQRKLLSELTLRLDERKAVDRAKGILMRGQQLSDDAAYGALRSAAMRSNQRLGQLSQQVIEAAQGAEAVNRAGQLRMLSQRLVKLHLLQRGGLRSAAQTELLQESAQRVDANMALLVKVLPQSIYGEALAQLAQAWAQLQAALGVADPWPAEACAQALLAQAEQLTAALEAAGAAAPLQVLNLAGRQRMLSQRFAKAALMQLAEKPDATRTQCAQLQAQSALAQQEFEAAQTYLNSIPLSTPAIAQALQAAGIAWLHMRAAVARPEPGDAAERQRRMQVLAHESEVLLDLFERLCTDYEASMHWLVG